MFDNKSEYLFQVPAKGQTGNVASVGGTFNDTLGVTGALAAPADEAPAEIQKCKEQDANMEGNFKGKFRKSTSQCQRDSEANMESVDNEIEIENEIEAKVVRGHVRYNQEVKFEKLNISYKLLISRDSSPGSSKICMT